MRLDPLSHEVYPDSSYVDADAGGWLLGELKPTAGSSPCPFILVRIN